jgi:exonuclease 3'-5' domain-containing protein 1
MAALTESYSLIDTPELLAAILPGMLNLPTSPPPLYVDLEGVNLSRYGTISILQIYVHPLQHTYLIDVHTLGDAAFTTTCNTEAGTSLKTILESPSIYKIFFDVRRDADSLYNLFGVDLKGVGDIQLLELATRQGRKKFVNGLARCISSDAGLSWVQLREFEATKQLGVQLFLPERGGSYQVFNERPMRPEILLYCVQDVVLLPVLWRRYGERLSKDWAIMVSNATAERLAMAKSVNFKPNGRDMALGPW